MHLIWMSFKNQSEEGWLKKSENYICMVTFFYSYMSYLSHLRSLICTENRLWIRVHQTANGSRNRRFYCETGDGGERDWRWSEGGIPRIPPILPRALTDLG